MTAESALQFEALEEQAARVMGLFTRAGYEHVAPAIIQPASLFLDRVGEAVRARTYVFADPGGEELCLRPDLTAPVCRLYLERLESGAAARGEAKFCYNGPAFRMQEGKPDPLRPREFRQAGIEYFGGPSRVEADLEVISLTLEAVREAGLSNFVLKLGHLGIFSALLDALEMPDRWRSRLRRAFWWPRAFARELAALTNGERTGEERAVALALDLPADPETAEQRLLAHLDEQSIAVVGMRRPAEVARILAERAADARERPLPRDYAQLIEAYLAIGGPLPEALQEIERLLGRLPADTSEPLEALRILSSRLAEAGIGPERVQFEADFGRNFEYYTGLVFQVEIEGAGVAGQIAGGGRYDGLLRAISLGAADVPAVGAAIHTQRLLAAAQGVLR